MVPGSEMFTAWIVVGVAGLATLAGIFVLTRFVPVLWLRSLLRCLAAVWLLMPAKIQVVSGYYAPAFIVLIFEGCSAGRGPESGNYRAERRARWWLWPCSWHCGLALAQTRNLAPAESGH